MDKYDKEGKHILKENGVDIPMATQIAERYVKTHFGTQKQVVAWLKKTPDEWGKLMVSEHKKLAKLVNPKLVSYQEKIEKFKKTPIEKYNPYQATELPPLKSISKKFRDQVWDQVGDQVWVQVRDQVRDQVSHQVWNQVFNQVLDQVLDQVEQEIENEISNSARTD